MKRLLAAMTAALMMVALVSSTAFAAPKALSLWSVYNINAAGTAYVPTKPATFTNPTGIGFNFQSTPVTGLLTTTKDKSLLGNLTGKTITATFTITGTNPTFIYGGEPDGSGAGATARLYFVSNAKAFSPANYWWSNPTSYTFVDGTTSDTITLSVALDPALWSDYNGQYGSAVPVDFAAAVAKVGEIGLSFGGGYFFANGVGVSAGSASFILTSYSVN
jgi:hypothetical protein